MVETITVEIEPPESIVRKAQLEADHGSASIEDQITDRLRITWEHDPRT